MMNLGECRPATARPTTRRKIARNFDSPLVHVLDLPVNKGKAVALSQACREAKNEILVFADARQTWSPQALKLLLENFSDPRIGAVSGDLIVHSEPGRSGRRA